MRIRTITLEGFLSYRDEQTVDLTGLSPVAITGPVHTGKSSLIDAIAFALWGTSRGPLVSDVINRESDRAWVALTFEQGGQVYRIIRSRPRKGSQEVTFAVADDTVKSGWRAVCEKHPKVADPAILQVVGMDADLSALTWLLRQNEYSAFLKLAPAARRQALASAFGLDRYADLADRAEKLRRPLDKKVAETTWNLDNLTGRIAELNAELADAGDPDELAARQQELSDRLDELQARMAKTGGAGRDEAAAELRRMKADFDRAQSRFTTTVASAEAELRHAKADLDADKADLDKAAQTAATGDRLADDIAAAEQDIGRLVDAIDALDEARERARDKVGRLESDRALVESRLVDARAQAEALRESDDHGRCIVCESDLDEATTRRLLDDAGDRIVDLEDDEKKLRQRITKGRAVVADKTAAYKAASGDLDAARRDLAELTGRRSRALDAADRLADLKARVDDGTARLERARDARAGLVEPVFDTDRAAELESLVAEDGDDLAERRDRLRDQLDQAREAALVARRAAATLAVLTEDLDTTRTELAALMKRLGHVVTVRDAFRPAGIPSMILSSVVDELSAEANEVMKATDTDGLGIRVTTVKTLAKGDTSEDVMVYSVAPDGTQTECSTLSGSEQFRAALAIRLGLARCIARRTGTPVQTIIIDEGWGNLDAPTRTAVAAVLGRLATEFGIITVSHVDDVKEAFDHLVMVDAVSGTSEATVVSR